METNQSTNAPPSVMPPPSKATYTRLGDLQAEWENDAEARFEAKKTGKALGPKTGLTRLDNEMGGLLEPGLHHIHGNAGAGKTALALQISASCGCPCLYVTCEMRALELVRRVAARVTGTFLRKFKSGELTSAYSLEMFKQAVAAAPDLGILDATKDPAPPDWVIELATTFFPKPPAPAHYLIIIDSLNSWTQAIYPDKTEYEALTAALASLRAISRRLDCPILVINERNRASMKEGGLNAGAGHRGIEYGAESVIDLSREKDAKKDATGEVEITLKVDKNRNGSPSAAMKVKFHGDLQRFKETPF